MATVALAGVPWAAGTTVGAFPDSAYLQNQRPVAARSGSATATAVVSGSSALSITGLTEGVTYHLMDNTGTVTHVVEVTAKSATTVYGPFGIGSNLSWDGTTLDALGGAPSGAAGGDLTGTFPNPTVDTGKITSAKIADGAIVNADVNASAAIAKTKLASLDVVNADVNAAAAIAKSKLAGLDVVNADVNAAAAIAYSKLALSAALVNGDVSAAGFTRYDRDFGMDGMFCWSPYTFASTVLMVANTAYLSRFVPSRNMAIVAMRLGIVTAATNNDNVDVGIYNADLSSRLGSSGAVAGKLNALGSPSVSLTGTVNLVAGTVYYAAVSCGAVGGTAATVVAQSAGSVRLANMPGAAVPAVLNTQKTASHVLPTSISSPAGNGTAVALYAAEV